MGRWDDYNASSGKERRDEWQKEHDTDFNWKETKGRDHPKDCTCPKCEYLKEQRRTFKEFPIVHKLCPDHYKVFMEEKSNMLKELKLWEKVIIKLMFKFNMIVIRELKYAQSDLCLWCRFGSGGRGIRKQMPPPDMP